MVERVSALAGHLTPGVAGLIGDGGAGVTLAERRMGSLWQIAGWPDRLADAARVAAKATGVDAAPGPGRSATGPGGALLRMGPVTWLLVSETAQARPAMPGGADSPGTVLDLSQARTVIRVEGPARHDLLARCLPLDLREAAFADGAVATSGLHHVGVTLHRVGGAFDLYVPRSFALSMWEHLTETAAQFGVAVS